MKTYSDEEVTARLQAELPRWQVRNGQLSRSYRTHGWKSTLMVVNVIGHLAEAAWHHPELLVAYASIEVRLNTHDAGGITDKDFELAKMIEKVVQWQPGREGGSLTGVPVDDKAAAYIKYD